MRPPHHLVLAAALAAASLAPLAPATAQTAEAKPRPKIGLVLGGGGARGIAHIGVLKVLEELRIPVDYVTGTSMGAIVGGTFAAGMAPGEMATRVLAIDWDDVLDDRSKRADLSIRRKDDERTPLFRPEFGFRNGAIQLPTGAVSGRKLELLLRDLTSTAIGLQSFDQLPTPFRAIATDLETGNMVVFDKGFLTQAMRASMSVPGAFDPVDVDGRLLVDGGLVRNVPIDIARGMGADVIIAVDVGALNRTRKQLNSLPAVLDQMVNISIRRNADESLASLKPGDVKIVPDLGDISSTDFQRGTDAIAVGEKATRAAASELARYSISDIEYRRWLADRKQTAPPATRIDFIDVTGLDRVNPEVIRATIETKAGDVLDPDKLKQDLDRLYARGDFESIDFRAAADDRGVGLKTKFIEKPWGPNFIKFGLNLSTDFQGDAYFNLLGRYTRTWINDLGGEMRAEASVGKTNLLYGELYQPLTLNGALYVRPYVGIQSTTTKLFNAQGTAFAEYLQKASYAGAAVGTQIGKWADVRIGAQYASSSATPLVASTAAPNLELPYGGFTFRAIYDQLDNYFFPTAGASLSVDGLLARGYLGSPESTDKVDIRALKAMTWGAHTVTLAGEYGKVFNATPNTLSNLTLGGLFRLSGLKTEQLRGTEVAFARILYSHRVARLPSILGGNVYVGGSLEAGNTWRVDSNASLSDLRYAGSVYFGADTFAGPFYLAYGRASAGAYAFYMFLGRPF